MMKTTYNITTLGRALAALALAGALSSCVMERMDPNCEGTGDGSLSVKSTVSEATVVKAESVEDLMEKQLNTLDVFVEHVTNGTPDGGFMKQYHLVATAAKPIQEQVNNWLADNWRTEGLRIGEYYNIYVATNNPKTKDDVASVEALKGLVYSEIEEGIAVVDEATNNIAWPWTDQFADTPSGFIYKQYVPESEADAVRVGGSLYGFTTEKEFMMDGILENWTPTSGKRDQVFTPVVLNRAAAKIVLNVNFDADFLKSLTQEKKTVDGKETWVDKPADQQVTITGTPAWRFYNFAFGAPVFAPETQGNGIEVHNSATLLRHPFEYAGEDKNFQIITYTYPNKWQSADYALEAPSLVISVGYTENGNTDYHYYRIPLVKSTVTAIERNHIYVVNATIATKGSDLHEDIDEVENLYYEVLPWNDQTNSQVIHTEVESIQHYYFNVNPKVYTLRGDGDQSVVLNYSKAAGTKVNWKLFTYDSEGNQISVVANDDPSAMRAWFYNASGAFTAAYNDDSGIDWSKMGVEIEQSTEGTRGSTGTVTVTSTALNNKAIKYIRLRVYLDEVNDDGVSLEEQFHEDIIIRHFPTDNIQNISGHWSSYHPTGASNTQMVTLKTRSLSVAQSWAEQFGVEFTTSEATATDNITPSEYLAHSSEAGYARVGYETRNRNQFRNALTTDGDRRAANGEENAVLAQDGYYYWGVNPSTTNYNNRWYTYNYNYYAYANGYRAQYTHTYTYTLYSITAPMSSTGNWVDWDNRTNHTSARTYTISYAQTNNSFIAKVYENNGIYRITESGSNYAGWTTTTGAQETGLNNNHMYVIQISSTSDEYVLGRPYVNQTTHQSNDNVVSPAFMIASQLGAVTPFTGNNGPANAATHCSQYMEVASDGMRYTGWRLPTEAEISVITGYQFGSIEGVEIPDDYQVLTPVLTGQWYHSLSGQEVEANPDAGTGSTTKSYLRCVRDLSAAEVERLNGFEAIQEKYRNQ